MFICLQKRAVLPLAVAVLLSLLASQLLMILSRGGRGTQLIACLSRSAADTSVRTFFASSNRPVTLERALDEHRRQLARHTAGAATFAGRIERALVDPETGRGWAPWAGVTCLPVPNGAGINNIFLRLVVAANIAYATMQHPVVYVRPEMSIFVVTPHAAPPGAPPVRGQANDDRKFRRWPLGQLIDLPAFQSGLRTLGIRVEVLDHAAPDHADVEFSNAGEAAQGAGAIVSLPWNLVHDYPTVPAYDIKKLPPLSRVVEVLRREFAPTVANGSIIDVGPESVTGLGPACFFCFYPDTVADRNVALVAFESIVLRAESTHARLYTSWLRQPPADRDAINQADPRARHPASLSTRAHQAHRAVIGVHFRFEDDWKVMDATSMQHMSRSLARRVADHAMALLRGDELANAAGTATGSLLDSPCLVVYLACGLSHDASEIAMFRHDLGEIMGQLDASAGRINVRIEVATKFSLAQAREALRAGKLTIDSLTANALDMAVLKQVDVFIGECDSSLTFHVLLSRLLAGLHAASSDCYVPPFDLSHSRAFMTMYLGQLPS